MKKKFCLISSPHFSTAGKTTCAGSLLGPLHIHFPLAPGGQLGVGGVVLPGDVVALQQPHRLHLVLHLQQAGQSLK
jgi:hypothetical protein